MSGLDEQKAPKCPYCDKEPDFWVLSTLEEYNKGNIDADEWIWLFGEEFMRTERYKSLCPEGYPIKIVGKIDIQLDKIYAIQCNTNRIVEHEYFEDCPYDKIIFDVVLERAQLQKERFY